MVLSYKWSLVGQSILQNMSLRYTCSCSHHKLVVLRCYCSVLLYFFVVVVFSFISFHFFFGGKLCGISSGSLPTSVQYSKGKARIAYQNYWCTRTPKCRAIPYTLFNKKTADCIHVSHNMHTIRYAWCMVLKLAITWIKPIIIVLRLFDV